MNRSRQESLLLSIRYVALMQPTLTVADVQADLVFYGIEVDAEDVDEVLRTTATERDWVEWTGQTYRSLIYLDEVPF